MSKPRPVNPAPFLRAQMRMLLFGCLIGVLAIAGCAKTPPEQALRETLAALQQGIEARDADTIEAHLAPDFVGPDGLDRDGARRLAALMLMRHDAVGLVLGPLDVQVSGQHATVRFTAAATGGSGRLLPDSAQVYQVETGWRLEEDDWRMTSATWKPEL